MMVVDCKQSDVDMISEMLASHRSVAKVEEVPPRYWPQGTGNR